MRSRLIFALLLLPLAACNDALPPTPKFYATALDGQRFDADTVKGKVVLIQFWATWCPYCRKDQESVDQVARLFSGRRLQVLAVSLHEEKSKVASYLAKSPRAVPVVLTDDTNLVSMYSPASLPTYVVLGPDGKVAGRQSGAGGEEGLRELLGQAGLR